jgi:lysozyme
MKHLRSLFLASIVIVAACGGGEGAPGMHTGEESFEGKVCAPPATLDGIDISVYQKNVDFNAVKASGRQFVITRVSDGLGSVDPTFDGYYAAIKAAGMIRGAYQYFEPSEDPIAQADMVLSKIGGKLEPGDLPPMIDMEQKGSSAATISSAMKAWLDHIENALHVKPIIYTGYYYWNDNVGNPAGYAAYPLFVAGYPCNFSEATSKSFCPLIPDEWSKWTFWQYSDGSKQSCATDGVNPPGVGGVSGGCDRDFFNGSLADLQALAGGGGGAEYAAQYVSQTWPLASAAPIQMTVGQTLKGSIDLKNVGSKPWKAGEVHLAPIPRDKASPFASPSWVSPNRVSSVSADVAPGQTGHFEWDLTASAAGDSKPYFGLVEDGVTWFADAPLGGGPPDNDIQVNVSVKDAPGTGGSGGSGAGTGGAGEAGAAGKGEAGAGGSGAGKGGAASSTGGAVGAKGGAASSTGGAAGAKGGAASSAGGGAGTKGVAGATVEGGGGSVDAGGSSSVAGADGQVDVVDDTPSSSSGGCEIGGSSTSLRGSLALFGIALVVTRRRRDRALRHDVTPPTSRSARRSSRGGSAPDDARGSKSAAPSRGS